MRNQKEGQNHARIRLTQRLDNLSIDPDIELITRQLSPWLVVRQEYAKAYKESKDFSSKEYILKCIDDCDSSMLQILAIDTNRD